MAALMARSSRPWFKWDAAIRLASRGTRIDLALPADKARASPAAAALAAAVSQATWLFALGRHDGLDVAGVTSLKPA